ncbi:hypothetical protein [Nostoc sp. DedQUE09]|uniref:hypothetical protein n=1 Tax=Nostoc sp. DedQUE09 TaxID=3075394 RepID=UPI002AD4B390|nr:hypothetical protein [Nostoc sp. DedQUE09]MDZ7952076.1 hypothetical protein [Nostoc sp. DedQUE09]
MEKLAVRSLEPFNQDFLVQIYYLLTYTYQKFARLQCYVSIASTAGSLTTFNQLFRTTCLPIVCSIEIVVGFTRLLY